MINESLGQPVAACAVYSANGDAINARANSAPKDLRGLDMCMPFIL